MNESLKITKIEKFNTEINNTTRKIVDNVKLLALFGTLIFVSAESNILGESEDLIVAGSVLFGTINLISLVKSIYNIYQLEDKRKYLENEDRQK